MSIQFWECCGKHLTAKAKCKKCGKTKPTYGIIDDPNEPKPTKKDIDTFFKTDHKNENNRKLSRLPKEKEGEFFISTLKQEGE
jgi:hypothetical protein